MADQAYVVIIGRGVVGFVTSSGYVHCAGESMARGYVPKDISDYDSSWSFELLGEKFTAKSQKLPLFDADSSRMRN